MLFYSIDRKKCVKETELFSHASTYILWIHNLNTEVLWDKLSNKKYDNMVMFNVY